jgi:hypothetical protein
MNLKPSLAGMPAPTDGSNPFVITLEGDDLDEALQ